MKTITTFCLTSLLSLACYQTSSAQSASVAVTTPSTSVSIKPHSVKVMSINSSISNKKFLLNWAIGTNQDADRFEVERSTDGKTFEMAALVFGTDKADTDDYVFYEIAKKVKTYYRVKIIGKDGSVDYTPVTTAGIK
jgi:hypothetical protein